jgi:hypothetical protein
MREFNVKLYVIAGAITVGIFLLGMLFGFVIEGKRVGYIDQQGRDQKLDFGSLQIQFEYLTQLNQEKNCPALLSAMQEYFNKLAITESRLTDYQKDSTLNKENFHTLKREYTQAEISYWLLVSKIKDTCTMNTATALYFYSDDTQCSDCGNQAFVLDYLKDIFKEKLLVFAIDSQLQDEALVNIMRSAFNVTRYPTVVVGDKAFSGLADKTVLLNAICKEFSSSVPECKK